MTRQAISRLFRWAGIAAASALTAWFVWRLVLADWSSLPAELPPILLVATPALALVYACLGLLLAFAWSWLAGAFTGEDHGQVRLHATTQVMKYLPGNVFHLAGRHGFAKRQGASHRALVLAALAEAGLLVFAAGIVAMLALPYLSGLIALPPAIWITAGACMLTGLALVLAWQRDRVGGILRKLKSARQPLMGAGLAHLVFFSASGLIGYVLFALIAGDNASGYLAATMGAMALAWLAGFLTPGAPAGLGVRESVLLIILAPAAGEASILALAALFRIVTVLGDGLLALGAAAFVKPSLGNGDRLHGRASGLGTPS